MPNVESGTVGVLVSAGALAGGAYLLYRLWKGASVGPGFGKDGRSIFDLGRTQRADRATGGDASDDSSSKPNKPGDGSSQPSSGGTKANAGRDPGTGSGGDGNVAMDQRRQHGDRESGDARADSDDHRAIHDLETTVPSPRHLEEARLRQAAWLQARGRSISSARVARRVPPGVHALALSLAGAPSGKRGLIHGRRRSPLHSAARPDSRADPKALYNRCYGSLRLAVARVGRRDIDGEDQRAARGPPGEVRVIRSSESTQTRAVNDRVGCCKSLNSRWSFETARMVKSSVRTKHVRPDLSWGGLRIARY